MRTTHGFLTHLIFALATLALVMTGSTRMGAIAPVKNEQSAPLQDELPTGVVVDDGVPF